MYEEINLQNLKNFLAQSIGYKAAKDYDYSCMILKLVIQKVSALLGDDLHPDLAMAYYLMGTLKY